MYRDYFNDVLAYYRTGQRSASLPQRLMLPTPASIRNECLAACEARFHKKDFRTLTAFFKVESDKDKMVRAIRNCDPDRFKPLVYLLTGKTNNTDDLNIELLAWLIDFPDRPFKLGEYQKRSTENVEEIGNELTGEEKKTEPKVADERVRDNEETGLYQTVEENLIDTEKREIKTPAKQHIKWFNHRIKSKIAACVILLFLIAGFYIAANRNTLFDIDNKLSQKDILSEGKDYLPLITSSKSVINLANSPYSRCTGGSPCKACSNCKYCNWCNSGGTCSICTPASKKTITQKRALQCQATTKKGKQCSRAAKDGGKYCWQHG